MTLLSTTTKRRRRRSATLATPSLSLFILILLLSSIPFITARRHSKGLPRSSSSHRSLDDFPFSLKDDSTELWSPSPNIDEKGFLKLSYDRIPGEWEADYKKLSRYSTDMPCKVRQVPGDGSCLFHALSIGLCRAINGTDWDLQCPTAIRALHEHSAELRRRAVACLLEWNNNKKPPKHLLYLQAHEKLSLHELVHAASSQYDLTPAQYCQQMAQPGVWGGGPELVVLANVLQRPIHVYELVDDKKKFVLRRMACFGSPAFDRKTALHVLSADSRFPDIAPGQQHSQGNHFLAVFPLSNNKRRRLVRGGELLEEETTPTNPLVRWWRMLCHRVAL